MNYMNRITTEKRMFTYLEVPLIFLLPPENRDQMEDRVVDQMFLT